MSPYTEWTFKLLHDREAREAFLAGDFTRAGLPPELHADFAEIDRDELRRTAVKVAAQLHGVLKNAHPAIFQAWAGVMPDDADGLELTLLYMSSSHYARAVNFAWTPADIALSSAFPSFLDELSRT